MGHWPLTVVVRDVRIEKDKASKDPGSNIFPRRCSTRLHRSKMPTLRVTDDDLAWCESEHEQWIETTGYNRNEDRSGWPFRLQRSRAGAQSARWLDSAKQPSARTDGGG